MERKDRPTRTLGPKAKHGVEFLEFLFASHIIDWITEKPAGQTLQWAQTDQKRKKASSLQLKDPKKDSLLRLKAF